MTLNLPEYKNEGGSFIKLKQLLRNEGDSIDLVLKSAEVKDGTYGKQLVMQVEYEGEDKTLTCDAPHEGNDFAGSQIYRGIYDNEIDIGDKFSIGHGGRMNNKYKTVIYGIAKDVTQPAPEEETIDVDKDIPF